jgi:predicted enzyme related to lactoylglutathione lyase
MCWLTVPVVDIDRAKAFYAEIFNWDISPEAIPGDRPGVKELHHFNRGKTLHGAFAVMEDGYHVINQSIGLKDAISVHPSFYVKNCKNTLEEVERLGGQKHLYVDSLSVFSFSHSIFFSERKRRKRARIDENSKCKAR